MRQNNKSLRADLDIGGISTDSIPLDVSRFPIYSQPCLAMSKDPLFGSLKDTGIAASDNGATIEKKIEKIGRVTAKRFREMLENDADSVDANLTGFAPVQIAIRSGDGYLVVDSIEKAVECLTDLWLARKGQAFEEALQACIDGINHRVSSENVRKAFINAANEAGISIFR